MLIKEKSLGHWIDHFYGYGSWQAKIWFVGHEDSGGDLPEEVAERLDYFNDVHGNATQPTLCDIRELYRRVQIRDDRPRAARFANRFEYRFGDIAILHGLWKNLIAFVHGYKDQKMADLLAYQKKTFASPVTQTEAWIQLYPLPSPHNHAWYYSWLDLPGYSFLKSRALYQEQLYQSRVGTILDQVRSLRPEVVVMYGMSNIAALKKSVQEVFPGASFKAVKGTKLEIPQHHYTQLNGTRLIITTQIPALRHNRVETGFDWEAFGRMMRH